MFVIRIHSKFWSQSSFIIFSNWSVLNYFGNQAKSLTFISVSQYVRMYVVLLLPTFSWSRAGVCSKGVGADKGTSAVLQHHCCWSAQQCSPLFEVLWHSNIECREQKFITYAFPLTFVKLNVKQGSVPSHLKFRKNCYFLSVLFEKRIRKMNSNFHITLIICALTAQEKFKWNQLLLWRGKRFDILSALLLLSKCEFYHRYPVAFTQACKLPCDRIDHVLTS